MGFDAVARVLIAAEPSAINATDLMLNTPLHAAAFSGHAFLVRQLIDARADINAADLAGNTPLHRSTLEGNATVAEILLENGADANALGSEQSTPLHFMSLGAPEGQLKMAELLLSHGADVGAFNRFGKTAHDLAVFQGHRALAEVLVSVASHFSPKLQAAAYPPPPAAATHRQSRFRLQPEVPKAVEAETAQQAEEQMDVASAADDARGSSVRGRGGGAGRDKSRRHSRELHVDLFAKASATRPHTGPLAAHRPLSVSRDEPLHHALCKLTRGEMP